MIIYSYDALSRENEEKGEDSFNFNFLFDICWKRMWRDGNYVCKMYYVFKIENQKKIKKNVFFEY